MEKLPSFEKEDGENYRIRLIGELNRFGIELDPDKKDQHIIVNPETIKSVVGFADLSSRDTVLEIGSGPGNITEELGKYAGRVYALEIDPRFKLMLERLASKNSRVNVIIGDFLKMKLPRFNKIVSNPPFSILEPMLQKFIDIKFELASLIIGEDYYQRATAKLGTEDFTKTSLFTQAYFNVELLGKVDKDDFYPYSRESSVIMKLISRKRGVDPILKQLALSFSKLAGERVVVLVENVCNQYGLPRGKSIERDYEQVISPTSLDIPHNILSKRLQDLSNPEISQLVKKLMSIRRR